MKLETGIKLTVAGIIGIAGTFLSAYVPIVLCVLFCIVFDVLTALVRIAITGEQLSSKVGTRGFFKKLALILALAFGIFLDVYIPILLSIVSIDLPFKLPIGITVGCYICLNESISILENLNKAYPGVLPKWIKKLLKGSKDTIDGKEKKA